MANYIKLTKEEHHEMWLFYSQHISWEDYLKSHIESGDLEVEDEEDITQCVESNFGSRSSDQEEQLTNRD